MKLILLLYFKFAGIQLCQSTTNSVLFIIYYDSRFFTFVRNNKIMFRFSSHHFSSFIVPHVCIIASHHIYNSEKKEYIVLEAINRDLSGCYLFGKPGRIIVEGELSAVRSYSREIRSWRWQKIIEMADVMPSHVWLGKSSSSTSSSSKSSNNKKQKSMMNNKKSYSSSKRNLKSEEDSLSTVITETSRIFEEGKFIQVETEDELREFLNSRRASAIAKELSRPFSATREIGKPNNL